MIIMIKSQVSQVQVRFSDFYEKWLLQQETNLHHLLTVPRDHDSEHRAFISRVMNHYKDYYTTKWASAHQDVLGFFSPVPWLTPLENSYLWITDWKPSILYKLIESLSQPRVIPSNANTIGGSLISLSEDQLRRIEELRVRTSLEEEKVEREMERHQVSMADRKMVELARLASRVRVVNGGDHTSSSAGEVDELVEVALKSLLDGLEKLVKTADCVRLKALKGVLEILAPLESVDFMAAFLVLQFQMRRLGKRRFNIIHPIHE